MWRFNMRRAVALGLALGVLLLVPGTSEAQRRGGRGGGGGGGRGWSGGWGGYYGPSVGFSYGYPGYGSYGYGRPYYGSYYGGYYGNGYYSTPSYTYTEPYSSTSIPQTSYYPPTISPNSVSFMVRLPDPNAEVWFQDHQTQQKGTVRVYQSDNLDPSSSYNFQIRARWMQNGKVMDQTKQVSARPGQQYTVDFMSEAVPNLPSSIGAPTTPGLVTPGVSTPSTDTSTIPPR